MRRYPLRSRAGQALVEYAIILALIGAGLMAILVVLRNGIGAAYQETGARLDTVACEMGRDAVCSPPADPADGPGTGSENPGGDGGNAGHGGGNGQGNHGNGNGNGGGDGSNAGGNGKGNNGNGNGDGGGNGTGRGGGPAR
jgi:Flp pilus assembly pilin Flp